MQRRGFLKLMVSAATVAMMPIRMVMGKPIQFHRFKCSVQCRAQVPMWLLNANACVNSKTWRGYPPGTVMIKDISISAQQPDGNRSMVTGFAVRKSWDYPLQYTDGTIEMVEVYARLDFHEYNFGDEVKDSRHPIEETVAMFDRRGRMAGPQ